MAEMSDWVVTIDGTLPPSAVKAALVKAGFSALQVMDMIGVITGKANAAAARRARALPGVADVARDATIGIGPPGSDPTW